MTIYPEDLAEPTFLLKWKLTNCKLDTPGRAGDFISALGFLRIRP